MFQAKHSSVHKKSLTYKEVSETLKIRIFKVKCSSNGGFFNSSLPVPPLGTRLGDSKTLADHAEPSKCCLLQVRPVVVVHNLIRLNNKSINTLKDKGNKRSRDIKIVHRKKQCISEAKRNKCIS